MPRGMTAKDWTGQRVGRLTVISRGPNIIEGKAQIQRASWLCRCDCGGEIVVSANSLTKGLNGRGGTRSCGCWLREKEPKHGMSRTRTYRIWHSMRQRCGNPNYTGYSFYGARGIKVCDAWSDFEVFFSDMGEAPEGLSIDRIDNSKGYEPGNCRWATSREQQNNMRSNVRVSHGGRTMTIAEWGRETGLGKQIIRNRLAAGWSVADALSTAKQH